MPFSVSNVKDDRHLGACCAQNVEQRSSVFADRHLGANGPPMKPGLVADAVAAVAQVRVGPVNMRLSPPAPTGTDSRSTSSSTASTPTC